MPAAAPSGYRETWPKASMALGSFLWSLQVKELSLPYTFASSGESISSKVRKTRSFDMDFFFQRHASLSVLKECEFYLSFV